jgi:hypothetical protein
MVAGGMLPLVAGGTPPMVAGGMPPIAAGDNPPCAVAGKDFRSRVGHKLLQVLGHFEGRASKGEAGRHHKLEIVLAVDQDTAVDPHKPVAEWDRLVVEWGRLVVASGNLCWDYHSSHPYPSSSQTKALYLVCLIVFSLSWLVCL